MVYLSLTDYAENTRGRCLIAEEEIEAGLFQKITVHLSETEYCASSSVSVDSKFCVSGKIHPHVEITKAEFDSVLARALEIQDEQIQIMKELIPA